jgi:hypothetical protein
VGGPIVAPPTDRERRNVPDDPLQGRVARLGPMAPPSTKRAIGYPTNRLLGVIDDPAEAAAALADLKAAGVLDRDLEILRGEESADRMDGTGEVSGWLGRLRRAFDFTLMDQLVDFAAYERALRDGRAVVMVHVHGDAPKEAAHQVLKHHGGHFINYYGRFATEEMDLWRGPEPDIPGYLRR